MTDSREEEFVYLELWDCLSDHNIQMYAKWNDILWTYVASIFHYKLDTEISMIPYEYLFVFKVELIKNGNNVFHLSYCVLTYNFESMNNLMSMTSSINFLALFSLISTTSIFRALAWLYWMWWNEKLLKYIIKLLSDHKYLNNALVFSSGNSRERLILSFKYWIVKKVY